MISNRQAIVFCTMAALDAGDEAIVKTSGGIEGAGAGGGLGLNAPGAGPKVTHFAVGGGTGCLSIPFILLSCLS